MIGSEAWSRRTLETHYSHATGVMASALLRLPQQFAHTSDSAQATDVPLVEFIDPVFTRMPGTQERQCSSDRRTFGGVYRSCIYSHARCSYRRRFQVFVAVSLVCRALLFPLFGDDTILNDFDLI